MGIVSDRFWRLEPARGLDPLAVIDSELPAELIAKVKPLDGILIGTWEPDQEHGKVHALGIVRRIEGQSAVVDWRRTHFTLRPTGQGATQWKRRPIFKFADLVAARYRLKDRFLEAFDVPTRDNHLSHRVTDEAQTRVAVETSPQSIEPQPSVVGVRSATTGPQCNRVAPDGTIFATPERGTFMGNRTSPPRWLVCDLHFKRDLTEPRKYTKLFFLDEAVALAAGHRPCNTCRRDQYREYLAAASCDFTIAGAGDLDAKLNVARKATRDRLPIASLPDGVFIAFSEGDYRLKWAGALHRWTPAGYVDAAKLTAILPELATVLTPGPSLAALRNGYAVVVHPTAG